MIPIGMVKKVQVDAGTHPAYPRVRVPGVAVLAYLVVQLTGTLAFVWMLATADGRPDDRVLPGLAVLLGSTLVALVFLLGIKVADPWEKAIVLRLGRLRGLRGPGPFFVIPVVDTVPQYIDHRIRATDFAAETCLTKDTVPVNVDAIAFWVVWDAEKSVMEVEDFFSAIVLSAQTALRDLIGKHELAELIAGREELGHILQEILEKKTNPWGITIQSVELRDVKIPTELEDAMSRQAQAERERKARIILGTAETEIAAMFEEAAARYQHNPVALHLRAMNILMEGMKERGSLVVVPTNIAQSIDLGSWAGLAALTHQAVPAGNGRGDVDLPKRS